MAPAAPLFLAPAEVVDELFRSILISTSTTAPKEEQPQLAGDEFLDVLMKAMPPGGAPYSHISAEGHLMGLTENSSATYLTSSNACLDFFFQVVLGIDKDTIASLLERAWKEDTLTALKLVFHLRGVRGTGKSDKETFYWTALWLHKHHPATLLENMAMVAEFGYFKDFLEVLLRLVGGPEEMERKALAKIHHKGVVSRGKSNAKAWEQKNKLEKAEKKRRATLARYSDESDESDDGFVYVRGRMRKSGGGGGYYSRKGKAAREAAEAGTLKPKEERIAASIVKDRAGAKKPQSRAKRRSSRWHSELQRSITRI